MEELVKYIVENLVADKSAVTISSTEKDGEVTIQVSCSKSDMGKVIGKNGKIAQSIRAIVKTASSGRDKRYFVKFAEKAE